MGHGALSPSQGMGCPVDPGMVASIQAGGRQGIFKEEILGAGKG